jgi:hypothetical protein
MALEYTNRKGDLYYVLEGRTKTGKPKYYCSRKPAGTRVDQLPPHLEIYEHPESALVSVRKVTPSRLTPVELAFLKEQIHKLSAVKHFIMDRTGDSVVIHLCDRNPDDVNRLLGLMIGPLGEHAETNTQWVIGHAAYPPAMRFTLIDGDKRLFEVERWCCRSGIDGWIPVSSRAAPLDELAAEFLPHLGRDSFFELI